MTIDSTMIFGYILTNRIQLFKAANIPAAFFLCRPIMKLCSCHEFLDKFQDDIHALKLQGVPHHIRPSTGLNCDFRD